MVKQLGFAAAKIEAVNGVAEYVNPVDNYTQTSELTVEINQMTDTVSIASGTHSTEPEVMGNSNANVKAKVPFCSHSATVEPEAGKYLECIGFAKTTAIVGATTKFIYTRGIACKSMGVSDIACESSSTSAVVTNAHGVMFNTLKIPLESGKIPIAELGGIGMTGGLDAALAVVGGETEQVVTKPTQPKHSLYTVNGCSTTLMTTAYELRKISIDVTSKVAQKPTMSGDGFGPSEVAGQETKISGTVLLDTAMPSLPLIELKKGLTGTFVAEYGQIIGRKVKIESTVQMKTVKRSTQGDILSYDIECKAIDNAMVITFNSDAVA